jgi:hypothetical protein
LSGRIALFRLAAGNFAGQRTQALVPKSAKLVDPDIDFLCGVESTE